MTAPDEDTLNTARQQFIETVARTLRGARDRQWCTFTDDESVESTARFVIDQLSAAMLMQMLSGLARAQAAHSGKPSDESSSQTDDQQQYHQ